MFRAAFSTKSSLSNLGHLNHVAIATPNLARSSTFYKTCLGAKVSDPVDLPDHGVTTVFVDLGNTKLELLHPLGSNSPISGFLKKNPSGGIHHVCIEVDDIHQARKVMIENQVRPLESEPKVF
jgi:methylmalonyl-CoA/ethylmalonyl-CoA epimerase